MRHTFASKVASLVRELTDFTEDVEIEWDLFKSAVITSAAASCGCKRVGGQTGSEKRAAWWNQKAIIAKKIAFRVGLTNKSSKQLRLQYFAARKTAAIIVKPSKAVVPKLFDPGAEFRFLGPPRAKARKKRSSLRFDL